MAVVNRFLITTCVVATIVASSLCTADDAQVEAPPNLRLTLRDTDTGELVPGRITLEQRPVGGPHVYHFVKSLDPDGTAVPYDVTREPESFEKHVTVSAHPFGATVPPGLYVVTYEHGPEWRGNKAQVMVKEGEVAELELPISRWIDMNERGWYSGDTHVHRTIADLPNVMRAEDLNVALPLSYWVREAYTPPLLADKTFDGQAKLITVDPNRVIWPMNTEYELFTVNGQRHTQGALFVLNHKQPLTLPAPPVAPIAVEARQQGAILDLDKHSWPWSMMLVPVMDVDLFELANNHIWRTNFVYRKWTIGVRPDHWNIEKRGDGFTEWGWIDFGFKSYYALLNCGFKMRPSAGTANGVHPVPLGYGRVYVECPDGFSYENWMAGLNAGRSFVTTGPMLFAKVNDQPPGSTFQVDGPTSVRVHGIVEGSKPLMRIEIVRNGRVVKVILPENKYESPWIHRSRFDVEVPIETTSWIAVRCFEDKQGNPPRKMTFAHSSPVHIEMPGKPLRPFKSETDYFVGRMEEELARNRDILRPDELAEYERARDIYARLAETAVEDDETTNDELRSLVIPAAELPTGWEITDVAKTDLKEIGANPVIISQPNLLHEVCEFDRTEQVDANVVRKLLVFYGTGGKEFVLLTANVCADVESAKHTAEFLRARTDRDGRSHAWHHDDVAVGLWIGNNIPDAEAARWEDLVETRVAAVK